MTQPRTLGDWRAIIAIEAPRVGKLPYSHNIIGIALRAIAKLEGTEAANQAIEDFGLEKLGWRKEQKDDTKD